jgi:selenocysteine-specific elongation factor
MPREQLTGRVASGADDRLFDGILADLSVSSHVVEHRGLVSLAGIEPVLSDGDRRVREALLRTLEQAGVSAPSEENLHQVATPRDDPEVVDRMLQTLIDDGLVIQTGPELRFATSVLEQVRQRIVGMIQAGQEVTVATLRDGLQTSRRYALAVLEYLDATRVTRRVGDRRVLGPIAGEPLPPRR